MGWLTPASRNCLIQGMIRTAALNLLCGFMGLSSLALAQAEKPRPNFEDFPVPRVYKGKPAPPVLSKDQRFFRTKIREGAKAPVQFAGHYTVPAWGCGAGCIVFDLVDSITGKVFDGKQVVLPEDWLDEHEGADWKTLEYRPTSRLFKVNGCLGETGLCGFYDYLMVAGKGLRLIRKERLPEKYQIKPMPN
jgi:hypothetical protein